MGYTADPEVVEEAGQSQFHRACGAARLSLGLEYIHLQACLRKDDRSGKAVGACADHSGSSWGRRHRELV